jgi:hypothetical protein
MADIQTISQAQARHTPVLMGKANVVGVGRGYKTVKGRKTDRMCVVVLVRRKVPSVALDAHAVVPKDVDGVETDVVEVGELTAEAARTERIRPAPPGVSLGHYKITAGTFGAVVRDQATGDPLILSNNHVLANSNEAQAGDAILQPGAADGGRLDQDTLAHLVRFVPIQFNVAPSSCSVASAVAWLGNSLARGLGSKHRLQAYYMDPNAVNRADAAVAAPVAPGEITDQILEIGSVFGTRPAELGLTVRKSGRTTGFTSGEITVLEATVTVGYGTARRARFDGQIISSPMSSPGDSGSLLVAGDSMQAVGLLFAGSDQATIFNPIDDVLSALQVNL